MDFICIVMAALFGLFGTMSIMAALELRVFYSMLWTVVAAICLITSVLVGN